MSNNNSNNNNSNENTDTTTMTTTNASVNGEAGNSRYWLEKLVTHQIFHDRRPFKTVSGKEIEHLEVAFCTHGTLNKEKSNAILLLHALTADQFVLDNNPITKKEGWWSLVVGEGKCINTKDYFIICTNVLGGCMGTTGPQSINPRTQQPYGLDFPVITMADITALQERVVSYFGIDTLFAVIGASMGSMNALEWHCQFPTRVANTIVIAGAARHSTQNIALDEVARHAIMADPNWCQGRYYQMNTRPTAGLAVARMGAHVTYMSELGLRERFGRDLVEDRDRFQFGSNFRIESYLRRKGSTFVDRFDANSYLYLTRAMNYFDLARSYGGGVLSHAFLSTHARVLLISFTSDWLFPPSQSLEIMHAALSAGVDVSAAVIETNRGHDAFLLDTPELFLTLEGFLSGGKESHARI